MQKQITRLVNLTATLPAVHQANFASALLDLQAAYRNRIERLNKIQEEIRLVSLDVRYMQFDLEATRRERDELKAKYE